MPEVISVRFRSGSKKYDFNPNGKKIKIGDEIIVQTAHGMEFAICTQGNHNIEESAVVKPLCSVLRIATDEDRQVVESQKQREHAAFKVCEEKITEYGLNMRLVSAAATFEGNKIVFCFTADRRVDFRALVRDLASVLQARIELRQIGVRDEARMIGGIGICGRPFCCAQFLNDFLPVSIKMAKTQNLSLNPVKISGACGRLMCCLKYEQNAYEDALRRLPALESLVQTPDGPGDVKSLDPLREMIIVSLFNDSKRLRRYHESEIVLLRNGKGSCEGIEIPDPPPRRVVEPKQSDYYLDSLYREQEDNYKSSPPSSSTPNVRNKSSKNTRKEKWSGKKGASKGGDNKQHHHRAHSKNTKDSRRGKKN